MSSDRKVVSAMYWWLSKRRPFFIGDEYKVELQAIDKNTGCVRILVTNLKTGEVQEQVESQGSKEKK
jgi:hypothetical protein